MAYANQYEEACQACGKDTNETCDQCGKPTCNGCLFKTGARLTFDADPRNEDYADRKTWDRDEELCLKCYQEKTGHPPFMLWAGSSAETTLIRSSFEKGVMIPAGEGHAWYQAPHAGKMLSLTWGSQQIELDTFRTLQLLDFLKANESMIREQAKVTSDVLVPHAKKMTEKAIRADLGIYGNDEGL